MSFKLIDNFPILFLLLFQEILTTVYISLNPGCYVHVHTSHVKQQLAITMKINVFQWQFTSVISCLMWYYVAFINLEHISKLYCPMAKVFNKSVEIIEI